jgi:hypothetical protein
MQPGSAILKRDSHLAAAGADEFPDGGAGNSGLLQRPGLGCQRAIANGIIIAFDA